MSNSYHGHDVMQMMIDSGETFTKETLEQTIVKKFGEDARFHTCSAENMNPEEIVVFLESRGKFVGEEEGFTTGTDKICDH